MKIIINKIISKKMDLTKTTYNETILFLQKNLLEKKEMQNLLDGYKIQNNFSQKDLYELIIITNDDYFESIEKRLNKNSIKYKDCYYYIQEFNDEMYACALSILNCGGYYISLCIFKNKINITNDIIYNKNLDNETMKYCKYQMNTFIGNSNDVVK